MNAFYISNDKKIPCRILESKGKRSIIEVKGKKYEVSKKKLHEGSMMEYENWAKTNSKKLVPAIKLMMQNDESLNKMAGIASECKKNIETILKIYDSVDEDEFPDDTRSSEGKGGSTSIHKKALASLSDIIRMIQDINVG
jgi:hypothetical protein